MSLQPFAPMLAVAAGALLLSGTAMAQTFTPVTPAAPSSAPASANINGSATFRADNGAIVTVRSYQPSSHPTAPPPAFASLDANGNGSIDTSEAAAYPPLANDFGYVDSSHDKRVSKSEYAHWVKQP